MNSLNFKKNDSMTIGVELELQLINLQSLNLAMEANDFLRRLSKSCLGEIKPEITQSMIEINSSIHRNYDSLLKELCQTRALISEEAGKTHIGVCGGGSHPFQKWKSQRIYKNERFTRLSEQYGYLAKQFTVFGQHIHIACETGDDALYLCHAFARYLPHFIALSAASPFSQGVDTDFDCSRLTVVSAFPLSGTPPWILKWDEFVEYYEKVVNLGIITSMKDFYWDIRPKPEYGTVELRICDTPLTVGKAAELAAYAQMLAYWLLDKKAPLSRDIYLTYLMNRFRASRYGFSAEMIDPVENNKRSLAEDILQTCADLESYSHTLASQEALKAIKHSAQNASNGSQWLRKMYNQFNSLSDTVKAQIKLWESGG